MRNSLMVLLLFSLTYLRLVAGDTIALLDKNIGLKKITTNIYLVKSSFSGNGQLDCNNLLKPAKKNLDIVFKDSMIIPLQTIKLDLFYFGPGHSVDNIVTWIPSEKILFGGCLLKSMDTDNIGNIKDADLHSWPETIQKIKARFREAKIVIPGHLSSGDSSLFEQTLRIIRGNKQ